MAADPQARRRRRSTAGTPRTIPQSVKTGRTNDEVKADRDALWISDAPAADGRDRPERRRDRRPMPGFIEPMLATLADRAVQRPRLAVRDQVGRLPGPGGRRRRHGRGSTRATATTRRRTSRACSRRPTLDLGRRGDRRRRGRRARTRRAAGLLAAPGRSRGGRSGRPPAPAEGGTARPALKAHARLPGLRPALPRRPLAAQRPARGSQAAAPGVAPRRSSAGSLRRARRRRGHGVLRAAGRSELEGIIAKHRRSRYEPAGGQRPGSRSRSGRSRSWSSAADAGRGERRRSSARSSSASTRDGRLRFAGQGRLGLRRARPGGAPERLDALETDAVAVRPATRDREARSCGRPLGQAGARDPGRARWLDAGRNRPPGGLQGLRRRPRPEDRDARGAGRQELGREAEAGSSRRRRGRRGSRSRAAERSVQAPTPAPIDRQRKARDGGRPAPTKPDRAPATSEELAALDRHRQGRDLDASAAASSSSRTSTRCSSRLRDEPPTISRSPSASSSATSA